MSTSRNATALRNLLGLALVAIVALGLRPQVAAANGGATIASAPALVLNQTVSSGWSNQSIDGGAGGEFWKVALTNGQKLTLALSNETGAIGCGLVIDVYQPSVTDGTLLSATAAASGSTPLSFTAPYSGTWIVLVQATPDCDDNNGTVSYNYLADVTQENSSPAGPDVALSGGGAVLGTKATKTRVPTAAQLLAKALEACDRLTNRRKRAACVDTARRQYKARELTAAIKVCDKRKTGKERAICVVAARKKYH